MRTSTAYFAGVGTVVAAIAIGLGGGMIMAGIVNPHEPKQETGKLARVMPRETVPAPAASSEPVPYAAQVTANPVSVAPAPQQNASPPETTAAAQPAEPTSARSTNPPAQPAQSNTVAATPITPAAPREPTASSDAPAKARDVDVKTREVDVKRAASDKRRAERRQPWAERRRQRRQDDELRNVELQVREETEAARIQAPEPARMDAPPIGIFDRGDD
ncbi:hypothetical protein [Bradyrhizobium genosp. P]|uniref:hypothetical protein n=1 Tax=Bradyrhizobium genosp. P TaxID=83641 RepID=UPI003CEE0DF3